MAEESNFGEDISSEEEEDVEEDCDDGNKSSEDEGDVDGDGNGNEIEKNRVEDDGEESIETIERGSSLGDSKEMPMDVTQSSPVANVLPDDELTSEKDQEDEENSKSNDDDDKESSYRSSPPESPQMSPSTFSPNVNSPPGTLNSSLPITRDASSVPDASKESIDDQEGELDFEEDTAEEGKEDVELSVELAKESENHHTVEKAKGEIKHVAETVDPEDDGEVEDDDDLEEGELKDSTSSRKVPQRPMCRFFHKGQCTWGNNCRFLHPGVNDKGNYNMFASGKSSNVVNGPNSVYTWHAGAARQDPYYNKSYSDPVMPPPLPPPPPPVHEEPQRESAWERGLRHAKEILKKSSQRKEMEPDFEEKRMNLSLSSGDVYNDFEKENDYYSRSSPYRRNSDRYSYEYEDPLLDPYDRQAHDYWRGGNYENFEVRYMRSDYDYRDESRGDRMREPDRSRMDRVREREREVYHVERERDGRSRRDKFERQHTPERSWRDEHYNEIQSQSRNRGDEWRDPWRRSTSPKRVNQSRSYSSNSSASYSSSRSSGSHSSYTSASRSSSASSHSSYSSRSYSRSRAHVKPPVQHKNYVDPVPVSSRRSKIPPMPGNQQVHHAKVSRHQQDKWASTALPPPVQVVKAPSPVSVLIDKKKTKNMSNRAMVRGGSISSTGSSRSSHSGSSHTSTSRSRSRSSSASSLESVSSKSSISSKSSYGSQSKPQASTVFKRDERHVKEKRKMYENSSSGKVAEKIRENKMNPQLQTVNKSAPSTAKSLSKDLLKQSGQKTQIKLTLLNKEKAAASTAPVIAHRKESVDIKKPKVVERDPVKQIKPIAVTPQNRKRPASPLHAGPDTTTPVPAKSSKTSQPSATSAPAKNSAAAAAAISSISKKSTSSRREELLKQLKAVEDAIARKRAKLS